MVQVVSEHPATLCYSPTERLKPFLDYLNETGISMEMIVRRPTLLGLELNTSLRRIVDYLQEVQGKTHEELLSLLETI